MAELWALMVVMEPALLTSHTRTEPEMEPEYTAVPEPERCVST